MMRMVPRRVAILRRWWWWLAAGAVVAQLVRLRIDHAVPHGPFGPTPTPSDTPSPPAGQPSPSPSPLPGQGIQGPLNILIVGVDTREWITTDAACRHSDDHARQRDLPASSVSLPRDLVVDIPAFAPARFGGQRTKLTHAMSEGLSCPEAPGPTRRRASSWRPRR
jgi:hypothetical protein